MFDWKTLTVLSVIGWLGALAPAEALDIDYPGALCKGTTSAMEQDLAYSTKGVRNNSTTTRHVVMCPAPSSYTASDTPYGNVTVYDGHPDFHVYCQLWGLGDDGSIYYSVANSTDGTGYFSLHFNPPSHLDLKFVFTCGLPQDVGGGVAESKVISYRLRN